LTDLQDLLDTPAPLTLAVTKEVAMLWESSKMEQRYDAVLGVIRDGFTVTEVAQKLGVVR
jgi:DNA-binding NarL/FixJ family response regulator